MSDRFGGFVKNRLRKKIWDDINRYFIFGESDFHSAVYHLVRKYYFDAGRENHYVRCEPKVKSKRPDIVVYKRGEPEYLIELKYFKTKEHFSWPEVYGDLEKMKDIMSKVHSIKWGYFIVVYDCDQTETMSNATLQREGYHDISFYSLNARRTEDTDRKRPTYDSWRNGFDKLMNKHKMHY